MLYQHARFVILAHTHPFLHWDLLLEQADTLRAWRLLERPDATGAITAEPLPDHRKAYLEYEGAVGGNRGEVTQWDKGEYTLAQERPGCVRLSLSGGRLCGEYFLMADPTTQLWRFGPDGDWTVELKKR
jgi:hypothetical protein